MTANLSRPPLDGSALRRELTGPRSPWRRLDVVDETGSTNADLIARAAAGDDIAGSVLLAEHQTAGRGRGGRTWSGVPRALITMSVGISVEGVGEECWGWLPLLSGIAVVDAVAATTNVKAGLKWPNDVIADGGKLAGILAEVASRQPIVVVGVGLNVTLQPDEIGEPGATSLTALGATVDRSELVRHLLAHLALRVGGWRDSGGVSEALIDDYRARSVTIGSRVRALLPGGSEIVGTAVSIDRHGRLSIDTGADTATIAAGDIVHLRPLNRPPSG
jgi:BirA family transcriptional regulator, biotin operon repressor / biotin---[acetyl-CoA-carboxylase] ligase